MSNYFDASGTIGFTCDNCGRELQGCTWVNGMRFCAKCYQETFGASKDWQLLDKDKTIAEQRKQIADLEAKLAERDKTIDEINEEFLSAIKDWKQLVEIEKAEKAQLKQQLTEKEKEIETLTKLKAKEMGKSLYGIVGSLEKITNESVNMAKSHQAIKGDAQ